MAKLKPNADTIKRFFGLHVEKIVLAIVVVLLVFFVWRGYSIEGMEKSPEDLASAADQAEKTMEENTWEKVKEEYSAKEGHLAVALKAQTPIESGIYRPPYSWVPPRAQPGLKRVDPELYAPEKLEVNQVFGPLAMRMKRGETDPLADLKDPAELAAEENKKKERRNRRKSDRGMGGMLGEGDEGEMGGMGSMGGMPGMGMPGMGLVKVTKVKWGWACLEWACRVWACPEWEMPAVWEWAGLPG